MIRKILASQFAPLPIALAAVIFLAYEVHHTHRHKRRAVKWRTSLAQTVAVAIPAPVSTPGLRGTQAGAPADLSSTPIHGIQAAAAVSAKSPEEIQNEIVPTAPPVAPAMAATPGMLIPTKTGAKSPSQALDVVITMLANSLRDTQPRAGQIQVAANRILPSIPGSGKPRAMTMFSISCYEEGGMMTAQTLSIHCRTYGYLSNAAGSDHIVVKGVVTEDVVSAVGKILIPAGSKVAGIGHVDPDSGRLESQGNWSIFVENHELHIQAELIDSDAGFPGIAGKETSSESELSQRQAVVRDGRYCFLADKTPFVLSLKGEVSLKELKTLVSPE